MGKFTKIFYLGLLWAIFFNTWFISMKVHVIEKQIKPVANCEKWGMNGKRSAVIYYRDVNEIHIECEKDKDDD